MEVWDSKTCQVIEEVSMEGLGSMNYLSINKKDGTMAIAHTSGIVSLWDVRNFD